MKNNYNFSERQNKIIKMIALNYTNKEIAKNLYISESTVKADVRAIIAGLNAYGRVHASILAYKKHLIEL